MPVNRVGSPTTPRTTSNEPVAQPTQPTTTTPAAGWNANGGAVRQPLDLSLPRPTVNPSDVRASMPNPVRQQLEAALSTFNARIETTLAHDAMSMARGRTPVRAGDQLTPAQQDELQNASADFVKSLPIGALSPEIAAAVQAKLQAAGISTRDIASTRLGDLGSLGGDIAKDLVKDLRANSPATFYGLAAGLAAAAGVVAYTHGSSKLASLGIKPEVKTGFFDDQLEVKLRGDWDAHFTNFRASASVTGRVDLGGGTVSASVTANSTDGFQNGRLQYDLNRPDLNLSAYGTVNRNGVESLGGSVNWRPNDDLTLSGGVNHNFQTNHTTATAEAAWRVRDNVDFALSASHDSRGESRIGAGVRIRF
ncbi:MAG: hypothetical protein DI536_00055 [Archangium gephyra]|uniref:Uncharacterized protein n=1 Tax=Archangium gephyra TaxID=48 RepID=A0A2W5U3Z2_9BACT|nr:MAG: hypothetical protein DI536_00055 [Archangium gephyra]